jgi:DNA-binding NarL/FixJ family response regulator
MGLVRPADACRALLRDTGAVVPRRQSALAGVPERLRALGVTARELEVLNLVAEGLTSRDIAERLYLSPRTVEKHVERLLDKTGAANRTALAALAKPT